MLKIYAETLAHEKVAQELAFAGRIQNTFLPTTTPQLSGWDIAATSLIPARQTSGDFYDFVDLGEGRLGILVADVADKGTGAALYMALSRTLLRTYALEYPDDPAKVLEAANERILTDTVSDQFVTVFYGVLAADSGQFTYANGGHNPAFLLRNHGSDETDSLTKTGVPLGMFSGMSWRTDTIEVGAGDSLILYTDGVSEAQNANDDEFGESRLIDSCREGQSAAEKQGSNYGAYHRIC